VSQQRDRQVLRLLGASRADSAIDDAPREVRAYRPQHVPHLLLIADANGARPSS